MSVVGVLDLFRIGIGPSSSHTVGPMRATRRFATELERSGYGDSVTRLQIDLFGSLGATGPGHGTISAVVLGLAGEEPHSVDPDRVQPLLDDVAATGHLSLAGSGPVPFVIQRDVVLRPDEALPGHPNGIRCSAYDAERLLVAEEYYSVGGGFVVNDEELAAPIEPEHDAPLPYAYRSADELVAACTSNGLSVAELALANERARQPEHDVRAAIQEIWSAMRECVTRGCSATGELPGGLGVRRRAAALHARLLDDGQTDPLVALDWVNLWALAVNEENAAGGRVVTAPTNGAAGIVPAVLHYYVRFVPGADDDGVVDFVLAAGAIGALFKMNASISGAEVGCQGEVGSACAMAAAGLAQVMGGSPNQVENAAEIALEHNLGLTCDPIGGLVQVPCIERNAMAATKAINAARLALHGDGTHLVTLDEAIDTLRETGRDMLDSYKETARGGLAVSFRRRGVAPISVPVTIVEC